MVEQLGHVGGKGPRRGAIRERRGLAPLRTEPGRIGIGRQPADAGVPPLGAAAACRTTLVACRYGFNALQRSPSEAARRANLCDMPHPAGAFPNKVFEVCGDNQHSPLLRL